MEEAKEDCAAFGFTTEQIGELFADYDAEPLPQQFEIHADNVETWSVFLAMSSQWNISLGVVSVRTSLKYEALDFVFRMKRVPHKRQPVIFEELRRMENAALEVYAEKIKAQQSS